MKDTVYTKTQNEIVEMISKIKTKIFTGLYKVQTEILKGSEDQIIWLVSKI